MARGGGKRRTYVRDNRGRFASTGATARGGRLKTAAGNKRKTVTARMAPAKAAGTIGKRKGLKARPAQPPKPSAAKVNQFQQASREAKSRSLAVRVRADKVAGRGAKAYKASGDSASERRAFRTQMKGMQGGAFARGAKYAQSYMELSGGNPKRGYRAPRTRLMGSEAKPAQPASAPKKAKTGVAGKPLGGDRKIFTASATARAGRMKPPITLKRMQQIGGNRWQKKGMDRVYFNDLPQRAGMDVSKYKSGNISSASLRGRGISNSKAKEIYGNLASSKVYYDRTKRKMVSQGPYIPSGRSSQRTTAAVLLGSVAKKLERQSRIRPTLRANQKRRKAA